MCQKGKVLNQKEKMDAISTVIEGAGHSFTNLLKKTICIKIRCKNSKKPWNFKFVLPPKYHSLPIKYNEPNCGDLIKKRMTIEIL